jgi:glutathione synthase/RimK-type ligase-like ATP-grasp enzyme
MSYDNTYILIKPFYDGENDYDLEYLESILKKYDLKSNKIYEELFEEDKKAILKYNISQSEKFFRLTKLITEDKNKLHPNIIFFNINYTNLNTRFYNVPAKLVNFLNKDKIKIINNKHYLYKSFKHFYKSDAKKYLPKTFRIDRFNRYDFSNKNYVYILKPVEGFGGSDILYAKSLYDVRAALEFYKDKRDVKGKLYGNNIVAQEYILNPLLFYKTDGYGYKCHFRVMYVISYINNKSDSFIFENMIRIFTAYKPYNIDIPFDKKVHDTHRKSTGYDYFLHSDYEKLKITDKQLKSIINKFKLICHLLESMIKKTNEKWLYPEHENGFQEFGIDFMVTDDLQVKLIEVNTSPGFTFHDKNIANNKNKILFDEYNKRIFSKIL